MHILRHLRLSILALGACTLVLPGAHAEDLLDIYRLARDADPQLQAAEAERLAGLEARPQARALLLPNVGASASRTEIDRDISPEAVDPITLQPLSAGSISDTSYALSLVQPLYNRGSYVQLRQAGARVQQAEANFQAAQQSLILRAAERYFNVLAAHDTLAFARAERTAIEQQLQQTRQRFEVGLTAITDVREAQARYDQAVAQEIAAENQLDIRREELRELTGQAPGDLAELSDRMPLLRPEPENIEEWVKTAREQNPILLSTRMATDIARENIELQRSARYPTVDVVAQHSFSDQSGGIDRELTQNSIGLQLNLSLYQGGLISSRTREARFLFDQASAVLEEQNRAAERLTRSSYLGVIAGISQVQALRQALASSQTALEATQAGFEVGTRTAVDVLDSQRELFGAERDYARARYDYILNTLVLRQATGILALADLEQVNSWLK